MIPAPAYSPAPRTGELVLRLRTVTYVHGGGARTREVDTFDPIRVPGIRGQLRQWWRALYGPAILAAAPVGRASVELLRQERALWGGIARSEQEVRRSPVELSTVVIRRVENGLEQPVGVVDGEAEELKKFGYAVWPSRPTSKGEAAGKLLKPGLEFDLHVRIAPGTPGKEQILGALKAWVLLGGVGGRTRRGCGALAFRNPKQMANWLPNSPAELGRLLEATVGGPYGFCTLKGSELFAGGAAADALAAWESTLGWVQKFRQAEAPNAGQNGNHARNYGRTHTNPKNGKSFHAPGRSNWPEPDKLRRLGVIPTGEGHPPRFDAQPAWPRADFGLPIIAKFTGWSPNQKEDGWKVEFGWRSGPATHDRLMGPLITKPLQLADGRFAPFALWMPRALPSQARVFVSRVKNGPRDVAVNHEKTAAPFGRLHGAEDKDQFNALAGKTSVRQAFFDWLGGETPAGHRGTI